MPDAIVPRPFSPSAKTADILFRYSSAHGRIAAEEVCQAVGAWLLNESRLCKGRLLSGRPGATAHDARRRNDLRFPDFMRVILEASLWHDLIHSLRAKGAMQGAWGRVELIDESVIMYPRDSEVRIPPLATHADLVPAGA